MAILNELDARGIDTSAADEAVQNILDTLRTDCQGILDALNNVQNAAVENAKKIEEIANVVSNAVAENPDAAGMGDMPPVVEPAEVPPALDAMNPDAEFNPDEVPAENTEVPEGTETPENAEVPPENTEVPAEPANPEENPEQAVSDFRTKRIEKMRARWGKTDTMKKKEKEASKKEDKKEDKKKDDSFKPSAGMISAAQRGF